jgi:hypothetical protein
VAASQGEISVTDWGNIFKSFGVLRPVALAPFCAGWFFGSAWYLRS